MHQYSVRELISINLYAWIYMRKRVTLSYMGILYYSTVLNLFYTKYYVSFPWHGIQIQQFFNRIAWHQIYHLIIKIPRIKIGNILWGVIKRWRSQVIIQVTWEKEVVFIFDDFIVTKYTEAKFQRDGIEPARFNTNISGRIPHGYCLYFQYIKRT